MWARLWHFTTAPRKAQWKVTQPQDGQNNFYLCKIIPLPTSLYPGHLTGGDDRPRAFSCSQPALSDSASAKGGVDVLNLVSPLEKDASFIYPGKKKGHSQTSFPCKTRMFFCDWSSRDRFGPLHLFQFHTPYVRVLELRRTWEHDSVRRDSVKTKGEGLCGEEHLKNAFCDKDKPFSLDWYWCTRSMKPQDFNPIQS